LTLGFGLSLVLLPLSGGSGLAMVPPLFLWLAGYAAWAWWSGRLPDRTTRAIGLGSLLVCATIVGLYFVGYFRPPHHPLPSSATAVAFSTIRYLSLAIYPHLSPYWWPAGLIMAILMAATLLLLLIVSFRSPGDRPRALGLIAITLSMLSVACTVAYSRSGFGLDAMLASRYVTLTIPLLCALYIAWLTYGNARARAAIHIGLLALICASLPDAYRISRAYGWSVRVAEQRVERGLRNHVSNEQLMSWACPAIFPERELAQTCFKMLKQARMGVFANYEEDRVASSPDPTGAIRR
jgi:hypothetical protein